MDHGTKLKSISFDLYFSHSRNNWLVLSFLCIFLSLSLSFRVILSGQGRVRDTFSRERQIIEGLWYTGEKESLIHA